MLIAMDTSEERAELAEQRSFLDEAQRQVDRLAPLVKRGAASESTIDTKRREAQGAQGRASRRSNRASPNASSRRPSMASSACATSASAPSPSPAPN